MGKLKHNAEIHHFSHPHLLQLQPSSNLHHHRPLNPPPSCGGCDVQIPNGNDLIYTCTSCNFFLHPSCAQFPQLITHPSHPQHALNLRTSSAYHGGFFRCDGCARHGNRFSYHCPVCDFDLHVLCASKPIDYLTHHHPHPLRLTFSSPYGDKLGFSCDVCRGIGSGDQWLYRCVSCEFDVHLHCATAPASSAAVLQHHHSLPAPVTYQNQMMAPAVPLTHSMSTGGRIQSYQPLPAPGGGAQGYRPPPQPPAFGGAQIYQPPQQPQPQPQPQPQQAGNGLADAMITGFVEGAMQQVGQNFVQSLMSDEGSGGGNQSSDAYDTTDSTY